MKLIKFEIYVLFLVLLIFSRFYNLEETSRFLWDESSNLVSIHQYWVERKLTFVGPSSQDGTTIFSSLTFYMLMPSAVLGNFSPSSTAYGAAFFGFMTALLIFKFSKILNKKLIVFVAIILIFWFPLLETSRFAWNPNFIPLWAFLGFIFYLKKFWWAVFFSGFFLGLTLHHHYVAIFSLVGFTSAHLIWCLSKKRWILACFFLLGEFLAILPFIIFDLRHPPGLFLTRILYFNHLEAGLNIQNPLFPFFNMLNYFTKSTILALSLGMATLWLLYKDLRSKSFALTFGAGWVSQVMLVTFIKDPFFHYLIPTIAFFLAWLIYPRNIGSNLTNFCLILIIASSTLTFYPQITKTSWETDKKLVLSVANIVEQTVRESKIDSANIATLESPDINTFASRYRDVLSLKDFYINDKFGYFDSRFLFVVSTSDEESIRKTKASEFSAFRSSTLTHIWLTSNPQWKVYLFKKY